MNYTFGADERLGIPIVPIAMGVWALGTAIYKGYAASKEKSQAESYAAEVGVQKEKVAQLIPVAQRELAAATAATSEIAAAQRQEQGRLIQIGIAVSVIGAAAFLAFRK